MLIVTTDAVAGYEIRSVLGEVLGTAVQTDQAGVQRPGHSGSSATFRVTGDRPALGLAGARRDAVDRLGEEARRKGANTVVGMRFDTAALPGGGTRCARTGRPCGRSRRRASRRRTTRRRSTCSTPSRGICRRTATRSRARRWPRGT
ncbi:YbjQ family protein [Actinomadura opuntiae]|uniref:YbjQ family protein n=1 Tax=Actinomadura sp. OS1-43 TaxID=604315 RepID=UPI00255ACE02|nr:heavy metal-binding domain-containing protein [Actinomadura sp. OS1-43]MDL4818000.1 heavy metal-binding domain-containing protein [Actinomadura sp. OS1-43]